MAKRHLKNQIVEQVPRLRAYARALTGEPHQADDLVQDCVERALSRGHLWRPDSDLRAWLFTIMHNVYVNTVRRARVQSQTATEAQTIGGPDADRQTLGADGAMILRDLERGLEQLPAEQREVLMLVCLEDLSYQKVAGILGIPVGTVMSRLHRARERMRRWRAEETTPILRRVK